MNNFGRQRQNPYSWIVPGVIVILDLLMYLLAYTKQPKGLIKGFSDKTLIYAGALNGDSPFYRIITSVLLNSSLYILIISLIILILTWVYMEKMYGFGLYVASLLLLIVMSGFLAQHLTSEHVTASLITVLAGLVGMLLAAYIKLKEQDIMIILIINGILLIASFFVPGHEAVNIIITIIMFIIGVVLGFIAIMLSYKIAEIEETNRYKQQLKEEEKRRKEAERQQKQIDKIRRKQSK